MQGCPLVSQLTKRAGVSPTFFQDCNNLNVQQNHQFLRDSPAREVSLLTSGHPCMNYLWFLWKKLCVPKLNLQPHGRKRVCARLQAELVPMRAVVSPSQKA